MLWDQFFQASVSLTSLKSQNQELWLTVLSEGVLYPEKFHRPQSSLNSRILCQETNSMYIIFAKSVLNTKKWDSETQSLYYCIVRFHEKNFNLKLKGKRDWLLTREKIGSDESKRPTSQVKSSELFGFEGSFRKLTID